MARIAITGAQSVGKSTILEQMRLLPELKDYKFQKETMRDLVDSGYEINESSGDKTAKAVYNSNFNILNDINVVSDRYFFDGFIYAVYFHLKGEVSEDIIHQYMHNMEKFYEPDIIFYIRPEFDIVDDGFRSTCTEFRDSISDLFEYYIKAYDLPFCLLSGTTEERLEQAKTEINSKLSKISI